MQSTIEVKEIAAALVEQWGEEAVATDPVENRVYIEFTGPVETALMIDCDLAVSHCLADLPNVFSPAMLPDGFEDLCVYANRLNITLARELGVNHTFYVVDDTIKLSCTLPFGSVDEIVELCAAQATESASIMQAVTEGLRETFDDRATPEDVIPSNAVFL